MYLCPLISSYAVSVKCNGCTKSLQRVKLVSYVFFAMAYTVVNLAYKYCAYKLRPAAIWWTSFTAWTYTITGDIFGVCLMFSYKHYNYARIAY